MPHSHVLAIRSHSDGQDRTVLSLTGDVDLDTAPHLRDQILAAAADPTGVVIIDLEGVHFMDSPGLGMLVHCHHVLTEQDTEMVLRRPKGDVLALLDITGLEALLHVER